jgi:transposase-like protein
MGIDRAEMLRRVAEYKASGKGVSEYCREHDYSPTRFYNWRKLVGGREPKVGFARVQTGVKVTVELAGGVKLIDLPIESLQAVLRELR